MFVISHKKTVCFSSQLKIFGSSLIAICFLMLLSSVSWGSTLEQGYSLSVKVSGLRNSNGVVLFSLYNKEGSIPDENYTKTYQQQEGKINDGVSIITFTHLPKARYAIHILHDENQNKKIDRGFILPTEGIGFSHYKSISLANRPNFSKASFILDGNRTIKINMIYF